MLVAVSWKAMSVVPLQRISFYALSLSSKRQDSTMHICDLFILDRMEVMILTERFAFMNMTTKLNAAFGSSRPHPTALKEDHCCKEGSIQNVGRPCKGELLH